MLHKLENWSVINKISYTIKEPPLQKLSKLKLKKKKTNDPWYHRNENFHEAGNGELFSRKRIYINRDSN